MESKNSINEPPDAYWATRIVGSHQEGEIQSKIQKILKLRFDTHIKIGWLNSDTFRPP